MRLHARGLPLRPDVNLASMAKGCHGYSGADLAAVCREAAMRAISNAVQPASDGQSKELKQCTYSGNSSSWRNVLFPRLCQDLAAVACCCLLLGSRKCTKGFAVPRS